METVPSKRRPAFLRGHARQRFQSFASGAPATPAECRWHGRRWTIGPS